MEQDWALAQVALNKAKIALMSRADTTFFTTVCFSLKHIWDDTIPTASTNSIDIRFNPHFFMSLTPAQRLFLMLHETLHVALLHTCRLMSRNHEKWNTAADHVINLMLIQRGFEMPPMGLADPQYSGMSTEQVYDLLPDDCTMLNMDLVASNLPPEETESAIQDILIRAEIQAKMAGDSPGSIPQDIAIYLEKLLKPKLPWFRILRKYLNNLAKNDYSFRKANRRYFPKYHLPSLHSETLADIAIAVDTSGSVTDAEFQVFITEVDSILRMMKPEKISLIQFDTVIKSVDTVKSMQELAKLKFTGRGGTRITEVMEWARTNKPQLLLMFSDGEFRMLPEHTVKSPVMWLIHNNNKFTAPFDKVVHYTI